MCRDHRPAAGPANGRPAPGPADERRRIGRHGERLAAEHLERLGFRILERNARTRHGEIDLVAFDGSTLVFAEVKTRRRWRHTAEAPPIDDPLAALGGRQRARLRRLAVAWLSSQRSGGAAKPFARTIRFDAIGVVLDEGGAPLRLDHLEAAW